MSEAWRSRRAEGYAVSADVVAIRTLHHLGVCSAPAGAGDFWPGPHRNRGFLRTSLAQCVVRDRDHLPRDRGNGSVVASNAIRFCSCAATASLPLTGENAKRFASVGFAPLPRAEPGYYGFPRPACGLVSE